ncbi:hypothetical protein HOY80DRAFT_973961 [Tuber brumale]|nr:hypothetical protein HOY80DRAFT_973961 [Tuber brumale]
MQFTRILLCLFAALFSLAVAAPTGESGGITFNQAHGSCNGIDQKIQCCTSAKRGLAVVSDILGDCGSVFTLLQGGVCNGRVYCCKSGDTTNTAVIALIQSGGCSNILPSIQ